MGRLIKDGSSRLTFRFATTGSITHSFDPAEFRGLDFGDIRAAIVESLPVRVDDDDVEQAAREIAEALRAAG